MTTFEYVNPGADYRTRLPLSILEEGLDFNGNPDPTSTDRRWLWRIEMFLSISGTNASHRQMASDLRFYLNESCEHHWKSYEAEQGIAAHRQCSWCNDVVWAADEGADR
jgi:hypothetical protein